MAMKRVLANLDGLAADVAALYTKQPDGTFALEVEGIEDTTGLKNALVAERASVATLTAALKQFEGIDAKEVRELLARFSGDEEQQLIKAGKYDQVIEKRLEKARIEDGKKLTKAEQEVAKATARAEKFAQRVLDGQIIQAATKVGLHPKAIDDALFRGRAQFTLDDDGNAVQLKDGAVVLGKDAKTPFSPSEWLDGMRESAPHWFPATGTGGGTPAGSGKVNAAGKKEVTRATFDATPVGERAALIKDAVLID